VSSGDDQHPASPLYVLLSRGSGSSDSKTDDNGALDPAKPTLIDIDPTLVCVYVPWWIGFCARPLMLCPPMCRIVLTKAAC
jgi:hypothetical protein